MTDMLDSKTNKMILIGMAISLLLIIIGLAVLILTNRDPTTLIALGLGKIIGDTGMATYRNVKVDGPIRVQQASLDTAVQAKAAGVDPMVWTPPPSNGGTP